VITIVAASVVGPFRHLIGAGAALGPFAVAAVLASLLFAGGLFVLSRRPRGGAGRPDMLDLAMAAAAVVLLAWMLLDTPSEGNLIQTVGLPLAAVVLFAAATKLVFAAGLRVPALTMLVAAAVGLLAVLVILAGVELSDVTYGRSARLLWSAHGGLLGAVALHPSFAHATRSIGWAGSDLSPSRLVLYGFVAALVPAAIIVGLTDKPASAAHGAARVAVPAVAASAVLVALVGRLALATHLSQRRSAELRRRSATLARAVLEQERLREELAYRAMHDPLTGLANRVVLAERLEWALHRPHATTVPVLLLVDLDGFKEINDTYGHPVGDELLARVAERLPSAVPPGALVARLGGDEFGILFEADSVPMAATVAENVLVAVRQPVLVDGHELLFSASIGIVYADPQHRRSTSDALRDADLALYAAKHSGKNRVVVFESRLRAERSEHIDITVGLRRALVRGELAVEYQPIVHLATGRVFAVEALARWRAPGAEAIPPSRFIPVAEASGLIGAVGSRILRQACHDTTGWYADHAVAVSVNVSGQQLRDPTFADEVFRTLAESALPARGLILELTEDAIVATEPESTEMHQLRRLKASGIRIAIDDFGIGQSSLGRVLRLPVDIIKLDRSITQAGTSPTWTLTAGILDAVARTGLAVVAEGVESSSQADALKTMNCEYAQGFFFHRPASAATVERILTARQTGGIHDPPAGSRA
jgi:diguanylate cyclase (GGDEF)-like protein